MGTCPRCRSPLPDTDARDAIVHMFSHLDRAEQERLYRWFRRVGDALARAMRPTTAGQG